MKKVLLVTEYLNPPYDEGIKKTVFNLYNNLKENYALKVISRTAFDDKDIQVVDSNALFISKEIKGIIKDYKPDMLLYFPFASTTFAAYLRFKVLNYYNKNRSSLIIALQPKPLKSWQELLIKLLRPKYALTPSPALKSFWDKNNIKNELLPLLTDLNIFKPIDKKTNKKELRRKYNLPEDAFIISHMGHLNNGRNLKSLVPLQKAGNQIVIVGSSSTPKDSLGPVSLKEDLLKEGIIILDGYIEHIEEIYQLSDIYIFPVIAKTGSIGMPLSIMEARGCGIPVITTDFGSLQHYLGDDNKSIWYSKPEDYMTSVQEIQALLPHSFNETKVEAVNQEFYYIIYKAINNF